MDDQAWPTSETTGDELALARRAARLDHTLKTMEALEAFRGEAAALRAELRELRESQATRPAARRGISPAELPEGLARLLVEAGFLIAVAVIVSLAELGRPEILAVMVGAWLLTALFEALATRGVDAPWARPAYVLPPRPRPVQPLEHTIVDLGAPAGSPALPPPPEPRHERTLTPRLPRLLRRGKRTEVPA